MTSGMGPVLTPDDVDDMLYLARVNGAGEFQQIISDLAQEHKCTAADVTASGVDPDSGSTVLHFASANGFLELVRLIVTLLGAASDAALSPPEQERRRQFVNRPNNEGNTALHWAAYNGHLDIVKALLEVGSDMWIKNAAGHLAMFEAERADKSDVVQHLLQAGGAQVERSGVESQPTSDDIADVDEGAEHSEASGSGGAQQTGSLDTNGIDQQP